eukprot:EG_transcript_19695
MAGQDSPVLEAALHGLVTEGALPPVALSYMLYDSYQFIETATGNKISRDALIPGIQRVRMNGKTIIKPSATLRGDLAQIAVGKYCVVENNAVIRPYGKKVKAGLSPGFQFFPIQLGDYVYIGEGCIVEAASVGNAVFIGRNSIVGRRSLVKDCCIILPDSVLAPDTVVPPLTVYGGAPAKLVRHLHPNFGDDLRTFMLDYYLNFVSHEQKRQQEERRQKVGPEHP